jgi:hypothetical protein
VIDSDDNERQAAAPVDAPNATSRITVEGFGGDVLQFHISPLPDGTNPPVQIGVLSVPSALDPVRVVLYERNGSKVLVRQMDPCDPEPDPVDIFDGDELRVMEAISHTGLHTNSEVGSIDGFLFGMRCVPVRVEGTTTYARTLRRGEPDDGRRVHAIPGGQIKFEEGALVAELDHIDDQAEATQSGYKPLTPVLATWLLLGHGHDETRTRFLLAAARRLDTANLLRIQIQQRTDRLSVEGLAGPEIRRNLFELVGMVEAMIIALGRATDMVGKTKDLINRRVPVPMAVIDAADAVKNIRDAYEHIDERATGNVWRKPHPDAVTIFDWQRLLSDDVITYGSHELDLEAQVPELIDAIRQFFMDAAADG